MDWLQAIRDLNEEHFSFDWHTHAKELSERLDLRDEHALRLNIPDLPPMWFNGDVEAIQPGRWMLVISLNPKAEAETDENARFYA